VFIFDSNGWTKVVSGLKLLPDEKIGLRSHRFRLQNEAALQIAWSLDSFTPPVSSMCLCLSTARVAKPLFNDGQRQKCSALPDLTPHTALKWNQLKV
jgi:hypothetical protein